MAEIIRMPRLSDTMEEGVIVEWLKKVGDAIEPGDILAEVETDKATMELESYHEGTLLHIGVKEGAVPVNGVLAVIGEKGEDFSELLEAAKASDQPNGDTSEENGLQPEDSSSDAETKIPDQPHETLVSMQANAMADDRVKASPLAKRMAQEKGINLTALSGSGEHGRIVKKDIIDYLERGDQSHDGLTAPSPTLETKQVAVSQMRKVIAKRLSESKFSAPHFYVTVAVDMSSAVEVRKALNATAPPKISFNDLVVKAAAMALTKHPEVNTSWQGDKILYNGSINIGVAVAVEDGLMVPVIRNADQKTLSAINQEVKDLASKARDRKLQPHEMQGNTFTISNLGMFDVDEFTAIINPPDASILAVGSIVEKPVVRDGQIQVGQIMKITLSSDHRVVDGVLAASFLQTLKANLEQPVRMLL